jgi:hypothetical protein
VPESAGYPEIKGNKYLNYMLKDGAREVGRYAYRDGQGNLKGYVFRIEKADGSKITPPLSWCENEDGLKAWKWQAFEKESKTPYGIEKLAQDQTRPVLVVEGEKTADAAQKLLPGYHVLTWGGGAGNVGKTNWEALAGRDVVIWPDNDPGGHKAAGALYDIIVAANAGKSEESSVAIVPLPEGLPPKWDLADPLPEGWTLETVKEMVKEAIPSKDIIKDKGIEFAEVPETLSAPDKTDADIEKAANHFIGLCVLYEGLSWDDPRDIPTLRQIEDIARQNMLNEGFRDKIFSSGNEVAIERLKTEMEEQMPLLQHCSLIQEIALSKDGSAGHTISAPGKIDADIEKAASHFIDLCVLYKDLTWDDPRDTPTLREIEAVSSKYMNNQRFRERIFSSGNEVAIERFKTEMEEQKQNMSLSQGL